MTVEFIDPVAAFREALLAVAPLTAGAVSTTLRSTVRGS